MALNQSQTLYHLARFYSSRIYSYRTRYIKKGSLGSLFFGLNSKESGEQALHMGQFKDRLFVYDRALGQLIKRYVGLNSRWSEFIHFF